MSQRPTEATALFVVKGIEAALVDRGLSRLLEDLASPGEPGPPGEERASGGALAV